MFVWVHFRWLLLLIVHNLQLSSVWQCHKHWWHQSIHIYCHVIPGLCTHMSILAKQSHYTDGFGFTTNKKTLKCFTRNKKNIAKQRLKVILTEAFPAVTVPSFLNKGGSLAKPSIVVWGLGCSSVSNASFPVLHVCVQCITNSIFTS